MSKKEKRSIEINLIVQLKKINPDINQAIRKCLADASCGIACGTAQINDKNEVILSSTNDKYDRVVEQLKEWLMNDQGFLKKFINKEFYNNASEIQRMIDASIQAAKRGEY